MKPVPPIGGNSKQYEYVIFKVPAVQSSEPPLATSTKRNRSDELCKRTRLTEKFRRRADRVGSAVHSFDGVGTDGSFGNLKTPLVDVHRDGEKNCSDSHQGVVISWENRR